MYHVHINTKEMTFGHTKLQFRQNKLRQGLSGYINKCSWKCST